MAHFNKRGQAMNERIVVTKQVISSIYQWNVIFPLSYSTYHLWEELKPCDSSPTHTGRRREAIRFLRRMADNIEQVDNLVSEARKRRTVNAKTKE